MRKTLNSDISQFLVLIFLSFGLLFFDKFSFWRPIRTVLQVVSVPVKRRLYSGGQKIRRGFSTVVAVRTLAEENRLLKKELSETLSTASRVSKLEEENRTLREQFELSQTSNWQMLPTFVIGKNRFLKIDKGSKGGVREGMAVVFKDILVGEIYEVTERSSLVKLVTDADSKILAKTQSGVHGILSGRHQVSMVLEKILPEKALAEGDLVLTRAQEGIPSGLLLGKIAKVEKVDSGLFQTAEVAQVLDFESLEMVFVTFLE